MQTPSHMLTMTKSDIHYTFAAAAEYGGSFFKLIGASGLQADPANKIRLLLAFPELMSDYGPTTPFHQELRTWANWSYLILWKAAKLYMSHAVIRWRLDLVLCLKTQ